jgi:hypothetical protein
LGSRGQSQSAARINGGNNATPKVKDTRDFRLGSWDWCQALERKDVTNIGDLHAKQLITDMHGHKLFGASGDQAKARILFL